MKMFQKLALIIAATLIGSVSAMAQPKHLEPGSVMIYPLFDSSAGAGTVICVTNTNDSEIYCEDDDNVAGDIVVHYQYIADETWFEFDRYELLTPGDTLCVLADNHNPEGERGFLVVSAVNPVDHDEAIDFDYLIGSAIVVQSGLNFLWSYTPYVFEAYASSPSDCDRNATDNDGDGALDFDDTEYDVFPSELFIDSFFEEGGQFSNQLVLMTTAGANYSATLDFLFWNNIEEKFSRSFEFRCWWTGALSDISAVVGNLGGDPNELGVNEIETGWASIKGNRIIDGAGNPVPANTGWAIPPVLGVFAQFVTSTDFAGGKALHYRGTLDGLEILVGDQDDQQL